MHCLDGSISLNVFKFQIEIVANKNVLSDNKKAIKLILSLKGATTAVLKTLPKAYEEIIATVHRKLTFQIYIMEFKAEQTRFFRILL